MATKSTLTRGQEAWMNIHKNARLLLRRPAAEPGRLCHGDGGHEWGARRRRAGEPPLVPVRDVVGSRPVIS